MAQQASRQLTHDDKNTAAHIPSDTSSNKDNNNKQLHNGEINKNQDTLHTFQNGYTPLKTPMPSAFGIVEPGEVCMFNLHQIINYLYFLIKELNVFFFL